MEYTECRKLGEQVVEKAKASLAADGRVIPLLFAVMPGDEVKVLRIGGDPGVQVVDLAKAMVKQVHAAAAVVVNEATFNEMVNGVFYPEYQFDALAVACVHPNGHVVWITPYAKEHGVTLGKTRLLEGENFSGPITEILKP
jgi:hypothetical protein